MLRYLFYFAFRERFYTRVFYLFWCSKLSSQGETRATKYGATGGTKTLPEKLSVTLKRYQGKLSVTLKRYQEKSSLLHKQIRLLKT